MDFLKSGFSRVAKHTRFNYEPRYKEDNPEKEKPLEERIRFERGHLLKSSNTLAKHRAPIFSHKEKLSSNKKWKLLLLLSALASVTFYWLKNMQKGWPHIIFPLLILLVLLVLFIRANNQR